MTDIRDDEKLLWSLFGTDLFTYPRDAATAMAMPPRRLRYLCEKWSRQGRYEWGVAHDLGWKVPQHDLTFRADYLGEIWVTCDIPDCRYEVELSSSSSVSDLVGMQEAHRKDAK